MVGPSTEELDSFNELIHFDHIYYKTSDPNAAPPPAPETQNNPAVKTVKNNAQPKTVSIVKPRVHNTPVQNHQLDEIKTELNDDVCLDIDETDLASLASQLEEIIDFDAIMNSDVVRTKSKVATSDSSCVLGLADPTPNVISVDNVSAAPRKRKHDEISTPGLVESLSFPDSMDDLGHVFSPPHPAQSESGYSSDLSDMGSPKSDISVDTALGPDSLWEDSLSELFPSLI